MARIGYFARGLVFFILGAFALLAAAGAGQAADSKDALRTLVGQPFGSALLAFVAAGLVCFALWRAMQAVLDADRCGSDLKGVLRRIVYAGAALFYGGFALTAASIALGWDSGGNGDQTARDWTGWLLQKPFGPWIIGAIGIAIFLSGVGIGIKGLMGRFRHGLELGGQPKRTVTALGMVGFLARAFVFMIIGLFTIFAAVDANAREAKGLAGSLSVIQRQPYGSALLGLTGLGLLAFGAFEVAEALYRRFPQNGPHPVRSKHA